MYTITIDRSQDGTWTATMRSAGRRIGVGQVGEQDALACVQRSAAVGLSLADIGRAAKRLARSAAIAKALRMAQRLARNPVLRAVIPPQVSLAIDATIAARELVVRARRDPAARARLARVRRNPRNARPLRAAARLFGEGC